MMLKQNQAKYDKGFARELNLHSVHVMFERVWKAAFTSGRFR
jgi:hypothetical protein